MLEITGQGIAQRATSDVNEKGHCDKPAASEVPKREAADEIYGYSCTWSDSRASLQILDLKSAWKSALRLFQALSI